MWGESHLRLLLLSALLTMGHKNDWKRKQECPWELHLWSIFKVDFNYKELWISFHAWFILLYVICYLFSISWVLFTHLMQRRRLCLLIKHLKIIFLNFYFTLGNDLNKCRKINQKKAYILIFFLFLLSSLSFKVLRTCILCISRAKAQLGKC